MQFNPSVPASVHSMAVNVFMGIINLKGILTEGIT